MIPFSLGSHFKLLQLLVLIASLMFCLCDDLTPKKFSAIKISILILMLDV
jgi:hypothetical protein